MPLDRNKIECWYDSADTGCLKSDCPYWHPSKLAKHEKKRDLREQLSNQNHEIRDLRDNSRSRSKTPKRSRSRSCSQRNSSQSRTDTRGSHSPRQKRRRSDDKERSRTPRNRQIERYPSYSPTSEPGYSDSKSDDNEPDRVIIEEDKNKDEVQSLQRELEFENESLHQTIKKQREELKEMMNLLAEKDFELREHAEQMKKQQEKIQRLESTIEDYESEKEISKKDSENTISKLEESLKTESQEKAKFERFLNL